SRHFRARLSLETQGQPAFHRRRPDAAGQSFFLFAGLQPPVANGGRRSAGPVVACEQGRAVGRRRLLSRAYLGSSIQYGTRLALTGRRSAVPELCRTAA